MDNTTSESDHVAMLHCVECNKLTTPLEAESRKFRTGQCVYCGGELENFSRAERAKKEAV